MTRLFKLLFCLSSILCSLGFSVRAASLYEYNLIPQPRKISVLSDKRVIPSCQPKVSFVDSAAGWRPEQYAIEIDADGVRITAADSAAAIWANRTLGQLVGPDGSYPHVRIEDYPEFPIRGFLYDDGRNFAGGERIKRYLDYMSEYKLNVFQWHLTDKPAWRIESKCHPRLNDGRFQRPGRDQGCFYTYDQIRDICEYARERGILVIPEIDMPGHSDYFRTTFGFTMDSENGKKILEECLSEFFAEIPANMCPYIHIGSDEVQIEDPENFMRWAQDFVREYGRKTMVWDPGLVADSQTIRQFWRDGNPEKISYPDSVPFVDSGMGYLNYYDPLLMPGKIYFHTPCGDGKADEYSLGGILCLWNDVRAEDKDLVAVHNGMAGGVMAFAERYWNGGQTSKEWLGTVFPEPGSAEMLGFEYFQQRMAWHKSHRNDKSMSYWFPVHATPWQVRFYSDSIDVAFTAYGDVLDLGALSERNGIPAAMPLDCVVSRTLYSDTDTVRRFLIGFDSPARSNRISDGIPAQGEWENFGRVLVNGNAILPHKWIEPEAYRYHFNTWAKPEEELPYTNEQLYWMREPIAIPLRKGDNNIELSLRRHFKGQRFQVSFVEAD